LEFYRRRAYRIFPAAYLYMLAMAALYWKSLTGHQLLIAFTYLSSYFHTPWILGHLWSLSVEEQFYLIWPFVLVVGFAARKRTAVLVIALCPLLRVGFHFLHLPDRDFYFPTVLDAIATGCLLAILWGKLRQYDRFLLSRAAWILPAVACAIPLLHARFDGYAGQAAYEVFGLTIMHIAIAGTIYNAVQKQWRWLNVQPVMWVGVVSYSLYLWQEPFLNRASVNWWNAFPANVILALLCASLSYYGVEKTFLQLRNREVNPLRLANDRRIALESAGANHKRQR
jgi:peptidoglycan/LPS O-acetylase OafA/YrhL